MIEATIWTKNLPEDSDLDFIREHAKDNVLAFAVQRESQSNEKTPMVTCVGWHFSDATYAVPVQTCSKEATIPL